MPKTIPIKLKAVASGPLQRVEFEFSSLEL